MVNFQGGVFMTVSNSNILLSDLIVIDMNNWGMYGPQGEYHLNNILRKDKKGFGEHIDEPKQIEQAFEEGFCEGKTAVFAKDATVVFCYYDNVNFAEKVDKEIRFNLSTVNEDSFKKQFASFVNKLDEMGGPGTEFAKALPILEDKYNRDMVRYKDIERELKGYDDNFLVELDKRIALAKNQMDYYSKVDDTLDTQYCCGISVGIREVAHLFENVKKVDINSPVFDAIDEYRKSNQTKVDVFEKSGDTLNFAFHTGKVDACTEVVQIMCDWIKEKGHIDLLNDRIKRTLGRAKPTSVDKDLSNDTGR